MHEVGIASEILRASHAEAARRPGARLVAVKVRIGVLAGVDADALRILYPNKQDFTLTASEFDGHTWKASFEYGGKKITDNYVLENGSLWLDTVTVDGSSFSGPKTKMTKCG